MRSLSNRKCLITGAASGIGRATALLAAAEGAELFLTDINEEGLTLLVEKIRQGGGKVTDFRALDIADHAAVQRWAAEIHGQHGSLDILMNIAGIAIWGSIETLEHRHWQRCIQVNLMGPINVMECFLPPMIRAGRGGNLVNVSSAAGLFALPWHGAYSASKFGLRGISEVLRQDLRAHRIHVSLVCPGAVNTGLVDTIQIVGVDMSHPAAIALRQQFQRHAISPEKAARAIISGVKSNRWMVFTSADIRIGYWFQRKFAWPYEQVMHLLNRRMSAVAKLAHDSDMDLP